MSPVTNTMKSTINMTVIDWAAIVLVVVGALNWGFIGLAHFLTDAANWNVVNQLFGTWPTVEFAVYMLVGIASLWTIYLGARIAGVVGQETTTRVEPESRA